MEEAVRLINQHRLGRIQRWDNLAELYCLRAIELGDGEAARWLRQDALRLLAEFRCGVRVKTGAAACALPSASAGLDFGPPAGAVPNPELTPMCFASLCERGFQGDNENEFEDPTVAMDRVEWEAHYEEMDDVTVDAAHLDDIERLCKAE